MARTTKGREIVVPPEVQEKPADEYAQTAGPTSSPNAGGYEVQVMLDEPVQPPCCVAAVALVSLPRVGRPRPERIRMSARARGKTLMQNHPVPDQTEAPAGIG
jgi:hypothetical protein